VFALVDDALQELFETRMKTLGAGTTGVLPGQVGIQPPDKDWPSEFAASVPSPPTRGLNVYLAEVRENRKLRSNQRAERTVNGHVYSEPPPMRVDCHYVISAWSNNTRREARTREEHLVLAEALSVLVEVRAITVAGDELPTVIAPPDGFPKLAEFWGTMADKQPWRPVIELIVTVPIQPTTEFAGTEVTTLLAEYRPGFGSEGAETLIDIGGHVLAAGAAVPGAWVRLESVSGDLLDTATTDGRGRFRFARLEAQTYVFRAGATGAGSAERTVPVPSPTGDYDLRLLNP
jgi:hypothetical protein